jgi:glucosyl-dolichyl phosphate glucuronosyltransferase
VTELDTEGVDTDGVAVTKSVADTDTESVGDTDTDSVADATVVIIAYTPERWSLTCAAVESVFNQTVAPREIILCVEGPPEFADRFRERWQRRPGSGPAIRVEGHEPGPAGGEESPAGEAEEGRSHAGQAPHRPQLRLDAARQDARCHARIAAERSRGVELARTGIVVFLDDDATAEEDWLQRLLAPFADPSVVAVGGAPVPVYAKPRPRWFPFEFDWVLGCAYRGLPTEAAPVLRLIGANLAVRRESVLAVGGFHSLADDLDLAHRLLALSPQSRLMYEPRAVVHHYVYADRLTWRYFCRRCFWANRDKVAIMRGLGGAANLKADRRFVLRTLSVGVGRSVRELLGGDIGGLQRALAIIAGVAISGIAYATGVVDWNLAAWRRGETTSTR